jgi:hypothetical protein
MFPSGAREDFIGAITVKFVLKDKKSFFQGRRVHSRQKSR